MDGPAREAPRRRSRTGAGPESSADLLLALAARDPVAEVLGAHGIGPGALMRGHDEIADALGPEPADWRLRLAARGGDDGDLAQLLAICRSADSHAYQLLEQLGVCCASLRREVIERARADSGARLRQATAPVRTPAALRPTRRASTLRARLGDATTTPAPVRTARRLSQRAPDPAREESPPPPQSPPQSQSHSQSQLAAAPDEAPAPGRASLVPIVPSALPDLEGRDRDLQRIADALGRRRVRVPLLVGPPGSGRTLLAQHLAGLRSEPVFRLVATGYDDEESLTSDLEHVADAGGVAILDDLDRVPSEAAPPFIGALSHAWTTGEPRLLTIVSPEGHGRLSTWLPGAMQSVDALHVEPLRGADLEAAVKAAVPGVLAEHGVTLHRDARIGELTRFAERFLTGLAMPARALDLLDLACARTVRLGGSQVTRGTLLEIVSERSGLPTARIEARADQDVLDLEARLSRRVVGHTEAIATMASLIRRNRAGFGGRRPVLSAILLGPSGVGKTELAKALCAALYDREDALVRLDMSEYAEPHAVARIVGAPPGYVGHEHGGALSDPLLARPHCVVLLDEIEKAHRDVHQLLLQVFDEGSLTDGRGRCVDFRHAVIIMTSNLGADRIVRGPDGEACMDAREVLEVARAAFPVELWNRIEAPLLMQPLGREDMTKICRRLARASSDRLFRERGIRYALSESACAHLVRLAGKDPSLGARPLRHLLVREVESSIADAILRGQLRAGTQAQVHIRGGRITLR